MFGIIDVIRKRLSLKILLALSIASALVMGAVIYFSIASQQKQIRERMTTFGRELQSLAYAGIKHPMAVGDSHSVKKQFLDVRDALKGTEIVICDFNQTIIFATHEDRINLLAGDFIKDTQTLAALEDMLQAGNLPQNKYFEEEEAGEKYLVTLHPMANTPECHHCHGSSRMILGGLIIRQSTDETYAAITALRNRTIAISIAGLATIIGIIYLLLTRLVTRPVTELADKAEQLTKGDLSATVQVATEDAIGILGNSFNAMVSSIKDQIEYANSLKVAIADPLFMVDTNMVITYMNEACSELTGFSKDEAEGKMTCQEIFQSNICESTCPIRHCLETGDAVEGVRITMSDRQGRKIPLMASTSPLKDAGGRLIGGVEICRDITDVLEAERLRYIKKIAQSEEDQRKHLESRAKNLLDLLMRVSKGDLKVRAEVSGKNEVMDAIANHTNLMLDNLEKLYERISMFSKDLELEVARRTMMLREKTLLLEGANRELRELDRLKSSFLANMSHELRTPMNSIIGYTELLLDGVDGPINEEQDKSLQKVDNNAKHLLQLINDILDMSKIESGKMELDINPLDIKELAESVASGFEAAVFKKGLKLYFDFPENLPRVYVDEDKVRQILINLLSNAIKFTHQGSITINAKPSERGISAGDKPLFVQVSISDTGIGIKESDIDKLFDKFSQLDVSTVRQYEGTGLGLSIARGLVVLHKGVIWADSKYGQGTGFHFTLPADSKILEKPSEPIIEPMMAKGLAGCFNKPPETFLKEPKYSGKPIKCWEYTHCGQTSCPAYGSSERRCWLIFGTHCKGVQVASYPEKVDFCKGCEIIERLILEEFEELEAERQAGIVGQGSDTDKKIILAIDDNKEAIELISKYLGGKYQVVGLLGGEHAVDKATEIKPAVITLDILMPKKDGWQVLQELKTAPETQDIPVIILSIIDDKKQGFALGAAEYLLKPIDKKLLLRKLKNLEKRSRIRKVLVVDNDPRTVELIGQILDEVGCQIVTVNRIEEARDEVCRFLPDLIVLNLVMPEANSFEFIEYLKSDDTIKNIPLILITEKNLKQEEIRNLDGRIQAVLDRGLLTEEKLLNELRDTVARCIAM